MFATHSEKLLLLLVESWKMIINIKFQFLK
jgi:hypothetical protein